MSADRPTIRKKVFLDANVLDAALDRIRYCFASFDKVVVSFSGGKDSTALLNLTVKVARELGRLPVHAIFFDEEAIHPPTIEYVERVRARTDEVRLDWYCLPVKHRNACSNESPWWYCWHPEEREKWVRPMPERVITEHPEFKFGMSFQEFSDVMFTRADGTVGMLDGVRTQESFRRMKAVSTRRHDNYISAAVGYGAVKKAHPIYDWSSEDVWTLVNKWGIDYNRTYDVFNRTDLFNRLLTQRVCPPFGEEPLRGLWLYAECFPEMWHKMLARCPGVATAWRYSNTELYGVGKLTKPDELTWQEFCDVVIDQYSGKDRTAVRENVESLVRRHKEKTPDAIPDTGEHPLTGMSWEFLTKIILKGDFKGRTAPKLENAAITVRKKLGIESYEEAKKIWGHKR